MPKNLNRAIQDALADFEGEEGGAEAVGKSATAEAAAHLGEELDFTAEEEEEHAPLELVIDAGLGSARFGSARRGPQLTPL